MSLDLQFNNIFGAAQVGISECVIGPLCMIK